MTHDQDFIGLLEDYLDGFDGETPLPERVRDAVRAELPGIRQVRPSPGPGRRITMQSTPSILRWGAVAAAVVVAVGLGAAILLPGAGPGSGGAGSPTPVPTSSPSPRATMPFTALANAPQSPCTTPVTGTFCITPGVYGVDIATPRTLSVTIPAGWFPWSPGGGATGALVERADARDGSGWGIVFAELDQISRDPCDLAAGTYPADEVDTPEEVVAAMAAWPGFEATAPEAIDVDGAPGRMIRLTSTMTAASCPAHIAWRLRSDGGGADTIMDAYPAVNDAGTTDPVEFRIVDVDGTLVAIRTMASAETSPFELDQGIARDPERHAADLVALQGIIDSIRIGAPGPEASPTAP